MAEAYIELAAKASLAEIINFWDTYNRLDGLFEAKDINITECQGNRNLFR